MKYVFSYPLSLRCPSGTSPTDTPGRMQRKTAESTVPTSVASSLLLSRSLLMVCVCVFCWFGFILLYITYYLYTYISQIFTKPIENTRCYACRKQDKKPQGGRTWKKKQDKQESHIKMMHKWNDTVKMVKLTRGRRTGRLTECKTDLRYVSVSVKVCVEFL